MTPGGKLQQALSLKKVYNSPYVLTASFHTATAGIDLVHSLSYSSYDGHEQIAEVFDFRDRYMVIFQYTEDDSAELSTAPTAAKLYDNSGFEV